MLITFFMINNKAFCIPEINERSDDCENRWDSDMHTNWTFTPEKIPSSKMRLTLSVLEELDTKPTVEESLTPYHV